MKYSNKRKSNSSVEGNTRKRGAHKMKRKQKEERFTKEELKARNRKAKYNDEEIARAKYIDSAAIFITRDRISNNVIDTQGKWVKVSAYEAKIIIDETCSFDEVYDFKYINVEIFGRKLNPKYKYDMSEEEKHKLTYDTAQEDIEGQEEKGISGPRYRIYPKLVRKNGKYEYEIRDVKKL